MAKKKRPPDPSVGNPAPEPSPDVTLEDFAPFVECEQRLTDEQCKAIRNMVYYRLILMRRTMGTDFTPEMEAAYFNGAMSVYFACKTADKLPSSWVFGSQRMLDVLARWKAEGRLKDGA